MYSKQKQSLTIIKDKYSLVHFTTTCTKTTFHEFGANQVVKNCFMIFEACLWALPGVACKYAYLSNNHTKLTSCNPQTCWNWLSNILQILLSCINTAEAWFVHLCLPIHQGRLRTMISMQTEMMGWHTDLTGKLPKRYCLLSRQ